MKITLKHQKCQNFFIAVIAAFVTALLLCGIYAVFGLFPFGDKTLAWGDMKQQVIPLMLEFQDMLKGKEGFLFNFQNAGGMSFWGVFFFFLSSPFTFLVAFIEKGDIYFLVNILVAVKLSLASGAASLFFREATPNLRGALNLFFACSYGLCGYGLLYYQNLVWLDMLYLFPILLLGFHRLFFQKKCALFFFSLSGCIVVNYYLSFMVLLSLVLLSGFFLFFCVPKENRGETAGKLGASAIFSLLLTAVVWLPSLLQCLRSARTSQNILSALRNSPLLTELPTALPVLLCTAAMSAPLFLPMFSLNNKRKALLFSLLLLVVPTIFEPVNKLFHTGSYQAFPVRYGYIPVLLALWLLADCLNDCEEPRPSFDDQKSTALPVTMLFLFAALLTVLLTKLWDKSAHYTKTLWFDGFGFFLVLLVFLCSVLLLWLILRRWSQKKLKKSVLGVALLCLCLLQGGYHGAVLLGSAAKPVPQRAAAVLALEGSLSDQGLYRVKQSSKFCDVNLLGAAGFYTLNHYTSLTDEKFLYAVKKLGYSSYWMETSACCGTKISDILLSNRYELDGNMTFSQTDAGTIGFLTKEGSFPERLEEGNRLELQNELCSQIFGRRPFLCCRPTELKGVELWESGKITALKKEGENSKLSYQVSVKERETLYFDAFYENTNRLRELCYDAFSVKVNGKTVKESYPSQDCNGILCLGSFEHETVKIEIQLKKNVDALRSFGVYRLKEQDVKDFANCFPSGDFSVERSRFSGTVTAKEGDALFLSIPYSPKMKVTVNGREAAVQTVLDCFLMVPLEAGENTVTLSYFPEGLFLGGILSVFGAVFTIISVLKRNQTNKLLLLWERAAPRLLAFLFFALLAGFYLVPILLCCL